MFSVFLNTIKGKTEFVVAAFIILFLLFVIWITMIGVTDDAREARLRASLSRFGSVAERAAPASGYEGICSAIEETTGFQEMVDDGDMESVKTKCHDAWNGWCVEAFLESRDVYFCVDRGGVHEEKRCSAEVANCL